MQGVEVGNAIDPENDGGAVDYELLHPVLQRRLDDPRIASGPVVAASRDEAREVAVALDAQAVAVMFDLVQPVGAGGDTDRFCGEAGRATPPRSVHF
jgi:hypothetical protein